VREGVLKWVRETHSAWLPLPSCRAAPRSFPVDVKAYIWHAVHSTSVYQKTCSYNSRTICSKTAV